VRLRRDAERFTIELTDDGPVDCSTLQRELTGPSGIVEILQRQLHAKIEWRDNHPGVTAFISLPMAPTYDNG
jgi:hypothetical protein